jgi:hypothetical protein
MTLTTVMAIWGSIVSTILALLKVSESYREGRPRIKVTVRGDFYVVPTNHPLNPYGDQSLLSITAVNIGRRPVTLEKAGLLTQKGEKNTYAIFGDSVKSIHLTEGKSHAYNLLENEIKGKGLTPNKYVAFVCDASGRFYWSHNILRRYLKLRRFR